MSSHRHHQAQTSICKCVHVDQRTWQFHCATHTRTRFPNTASVVDHGCHPTQHERDSAQRLRLDCGPRASGRWHERRQRLRLDCDPRASGCWYERHQRMCLDCGPRASGRWYERHQRLRLLNCDPWASRRLYERRQRLRLDCGLRASGRWYERRHLWPDRMWPDRTCHVSQSGASAYVNVNTPARTTVRHQLLRRLPCRGHGQRWNVNIFWCRRSTPSSPSLSTHQAEHEKQNRPRYVDGCEVTFCHMRSVLPRKTAAGSRAAPAVGQECACESKRRSCSPSLMACAFPQPEKWLQVWLCERRRRRTSSKHV